MAEIFFFDETGVNPLPAGLFVTIWAAPGGQYTSWRRVNNQVPLPLYDGMTQKGGVFINPNIALQGGAEYGALFVGTQAPGMCETHFIANANVDGNGNPLPSTGDAIGYNSPSHSQLGYTNDQVNHLWPRGWWGDTAREPGGVAYGVAYGLAGLLGSPIIDGVVDDNPSHIDVTTPTLNNQVSNAGHWSLDASVQGLLAEQRLDSCTGADIDSWAADILGNVFLRCVDEDDYTWIQQIKQILQIIRSPGLPTIAGLQQILNMLYPCILLEFEQFLANDTKGGVDSWGGLDIVPSPPGAASITMGMDVYGAMDLPTTFMDVMSSPVVNQAPNIIVFDMESNPTLASLISPNIVPPQFCVYFQYTAFPDSAIHQIAPQLPGLVNLVNACKAAGTQVIYASNAS